MRVKELEICEIVTMPKDKKEGLLYVSRKYELAIHLCACGCRGEAVTPLDAGSGWILTQGPNGPTLRPSIGHQKWPCKSHYYITDGKIVDLN